MAWTGTPTVTALGQNIWRITGVSLVSSAVGTIGFKNSGKNIELPRLFPTNLNGLTISDLVEARFVHTTPGGGNESRHVHVDKSGTQNSDFTITFTNDANQDTSPLEIFVQFFHAAIR